MPRPRLLPIPDVPNRRHPAYDATFEAFLRSGGSVVRALRLLEEMWDPDLYGAELPSERTVRTWVREDMWEPICRDFASTNKRRIRNAINSDILLTMSDMITIVKEIAYDDEPERAKINSVRMGAARTILQLGAAGVQEVRMGDLPDHDVDNEEAVARARLMSPEDVLAAEAAEMAEEGES